MALGCGAAVALATASPPEKTASSVDPAVVRKLLQDLASDDYATREKATESLARLTAVPSELVEAAKSSELEVRSRARRAIRAIESRAEEKSLAAMEADPKNVELDRLIRRMVTEPHFSGDRQWKLLHTIVAGVRESGRKLDGKPRAFFQFDIRSMPQTHGLRSEELWVEGKRVLLKNSGDVLLALSKSLVLSAGPMPNVDTLEECVVIVDGDVRSTRYIRNSVLIVRGKLGRLKEVQNSIILATGELESAETVNESIIEVANRKLEIRQGTKNVVVSGVPSGSKVDGKSVTTERGLLRLLRFSADKPAEKKPVEK